MVCNAEVIAILTGNPALLIAIVAAHAGIVLAGASVYVKAARRAGEELMRKMELAGVSAALEAKARELEQAAEQAQADILIQDQNGNEIALRQTEGEAVELVGIRVKGQFNPMGTAVRGKLIQEYAEQQVREKVKARGFAVVGKETGGNGEVKLSLRKPGGGDATEADVTIGLDGLAHLHMHGVDDKQFQDLTGFLSSALGKQVSSTFNENAYKQYLRTHGKVEQRAFVRVGQTR